MWAKIKMGSGNFLLVLKRDNIADSLAQAFDSRLREKINNAKNVIFAKISVFLLGKSPIFNFWKKNCWIMFIHIILHQKKW